MWVPATCLELGKGWRGLEKQLRGGGGPFGSRGYSPGNAGPGSVSLVFVDLLSWFYLFLKLPVVLEALAEA